MKHFTLSFVLLIASCSLVAAASAAGKQTPGKIGSGKSTTATTTKRIEAPQLMAALSLIESGDNDRAVGKAGEVSRYQIMPNVWRAYGGGNPRNSAEAKRIATKIMSARIAKFEAQHSRQPSMVEVYALWRSPARAMQLKLSAAVRECGHRFSNLVSEPQES
jgi:hypothetical protein